MSEIVQLSYEGIPSPICGGCDGDWLVIPVRFDRETYEIVMYATEGKCLNCGSNVTACTPVDLPEEREARGWDGE